VARGSISGDPKPNHDLHEHRNLRTKTEPSPPCTVRTADEELLARIQARENRRWQPCNNVMHHSCDGHFQRRKQ